MKIDDLLEQSTIDDARHVLRCSHQFGKGRGKAYWMKCRLLHTSKTGKACIVVFGERNWKDREHVKQIRYVEFTRLKNMYPCVGGPVDGKYYPWLTTFMQINANTVNHETGYARIRAHRYAFNSDTLQYDYLGIMK